MGNLKLEYRNLETKVLWQLRLKIMESTVQSKYIQGNAIPVNVYGYEELAIVNDRLTFLDNGGLQYSVFADANLEDLIDILES